MGSSPLLPTQREIQDRLKSWAASRSDRDPQGRHARLLAADLDVPEGVAAWARVDLHQHFRQLTGPGNAAQAVLSWLLSISYLAPIAITWFHLRDAVAAYARLSVPAPERPNFLSFWVGVGGDKLDYTPLSSAALHLLLALAVIAVLQASYSPLLRISQMRQRRLEGLLSECSVYVRRLGAVTPDEVAGALQKSAKAIESAVQAAAESLAGISGVAEKIVESSDRLMNAAGTLRDSTDSMAHAAQRLDDLPPKISDILRELTALEQATRETVSATGKINGELITVVDQLQQTGSVSSALVRTQESVVDTLANVGRLSLGATSTAESLASALERLNQQIRLIDDVVRANAEDFLLVNSTGGELKGAFAQLERISRQFEHAASEFERLSRTGQNG